MFTPTARLLFNYYLVTVTMWQSTRNNSSFSELENIHFYFNLHKVLVYIWFHGVTVDLTQETVIKVEWLAGNVLMRRFEEQSFEWWDERWSAGVGEVGRQSWWCEGHPSEWRQHGGTGCGRAERLIINRVNTELKLKPSHLEARCVWVLTRLLVRRQDWRGGQDEPGSLLIQRLGLPPHCHRRQILTKPNWEHIILRISLDLENKLK